MYQKCVSLHFLRWAFCACFSSKSAINLRTQGAFQLVSRMYEKLVDFSDDAIAHNFREPKKQNNN